MRRDLGHNGVMPEFLTTKEVAALLRIKERKVYELVAEHAIPVSRVTGKLLFPREMVEAWVWRQAEYAGGTEGLHARPPVLAGHHDPLLEWALRQSGSELAAFFDGSLDGLARLAAGKAIAAGLHVYEPEAAPSSPRGLEPRPPSARWRGCRSCWSSGPGACRAWSCRRATRSGSQRSAISRAARWCRGRNAPAAPSAARLPDAPRRPRPGAGSSCVTPPARSEADVALAIAEGKADAGFAVETVARQFRLGFVPLFRERYDLAIWRRDYFEPPLQKLLSFARSPAFVRRAAELAGYDVAGLGTVHYNGP